MSYILEALEKSEKERQEKTVPGLQPQQTVYPRMTRKGAARGSGRRLRPGILLALALIPSVWLLRDHLPMELEIRVSRQISNSTQPAVSQLPATPDETAQPDMPAVTRQAVDEQTQQEAEQRENGQEIADRQQPVALPPETVGENGEELVQPRQAVASVPDEETVVMQEEIRLQPAPILLDGRQESENAIIPLPYKDELPGDIQQQLPVLKFAGHTYAKEPGQRLIIVNNNISREGDLVEPGLHLKEITWDGVILDYRGISFQVRTTGP